jgi:hypothetical protein
MVYLHVPPQERYGAKNPMDKYIDVETVLVMPTGSNDATKAIRPLWIKESVSVFSNLFGAQYQSRGMVAAVPMNVMGPDFEFVAIYGEKPMMGGGPSGRELRGTNVEREWK